MGVLSQQQEGNYNSVLMRRGDQDIGMWREDYVRTQGEDPIYKPRREITDGANPAHTLVSDFQSTDWEEICFWEEGHSLSWPPQHTTAGSVHGL